jgi:hypothetical protein
MFRFRHPFSLLVAGPTRCGKTYFVSQLLGTEGVIDPKPESVYWCYGAENLEQQEFLESISLYPIEFSQGLPIMEEIEQRPNSLIVLDDLMDDAANSKEIANLFTRGVHHKKLSVLLLVQNLFSNGKKAREISLNCNYIVLFKNPRDNSQINTLARQVFPNKPKYLREAFALATARPFGYLLLDLTQQTPETLRLMTNIFPLQIFYYLIPKR